MLDEEDQNELNRALAVGYMVQGVMTVGLKKIMKDIDTHKNIHLRLYFRSLLDDAIEIMKRDRIPIKR